MIIILTNSDLQERSREKPIGTMMENDYRSYVSTACLYAEDVYFWRDGVITALKRRNAPLIVPEWLEGRGGVDE